MTLRRVAVIVTALPVETSAIISYLERRRVEYAPEDGTAFELGELSIEDVRWEIALVEAGAGNTTVALRAQRAIDRFKPAVALFVGVAGGIKDVALADVVFATKVYGYESGKETTRFMPRPDVGRSSYRLEQCARVIARNEVSVLSLGAHTHVAPIAAGEKVVARRHSATARMLRELYSDAVAVEMEGRGFLEACFTQSVEAAVVRGISDLLSGKSAADRSGSQEVAARNAAAFAVRLLGCTSLESATEAPTIPYTRRQLVGREDVLEQISGHIFREGFSVVSLQGSPGIGKTRIALELALRYRAQYPSAVVHWIRARDHQTLQEDASVLASNLGAVLPLGDPIAEACVRLQHAKDWLVVLDDVAEPGVVRQMISGHRVGTLVMTTQDADTADLGQRFVLQSLSLEKCVDLFESECGTLSDYDRQVAQSITLHLGMLPLAVHQAARYIDATGVTFSDYLRLLQTRPLELLSRYAPSDHLMPIATAWNLSLELLGREETARSLFYFCLFVNPDGLPFSFLVEPLRLQDSSRLPARLRAVICDEVLRNDAIHRLSMLGLAETVEGMVTIHPATADIARAGLAAEDFDYFADAAVAI